VAILAGAAVAVAILAGTRLIGPRPAEPVAGPSRPVTVTFTDRTTTVTPPGVAVTMPQPLVTADDPGVADRVTEVIERHVADAVDAFRNRTAENLAQGGSAAHLSARITAADTVTWRRYLSVRLDSSAEVGDEHPVNESVALTFDTGTSDQVLPTDLFLDVDRAAAVVRDALRSSRTVGYDLAAVSLRPSEAGTTTPLSCYPAPAGLHCLLDQNTLAPYAAGRLEATVPWDRLTPLLRPGVAD
jgi:hypothetical protein